MNFSEQPPSKQWAALKFRGVIIAEVWFKPADEPLGLLVRIPRATFQIAGMQQRLTAEALLKALGIAVETIANWVCEGVFHAGVDGTNPELQQTLPATDATHVNLHFTLKPPEVAAPAASGAAIPEEKWQELAARWKAILEAEASIDAIRVSMETLRAEIEASSRRTLTSDEKIHAPNADVAQWNKAKTRALYALPKVREFIHRSTWATSAPERKKLEEVFKNHIRTRIPFPEIERALEQLDNLLKDRQVLTAHGMSTYQECKGVSVDVQGALRTLQANAVAKAAQKKAPSRAKGRNF